MKLVKGGENPFDYLTSLKSGGLKATHGEDFDPSTLSKSRSIITAGNFDDAEIDIASQIRQLVDSKIIVPKDMKIDDGDLPTAANFYQWVTEERFGAVGEERPFLEQLIWGIITFNDHCYSCSDLEWLYHDHKPDDTYAKFERKVALLHHGVCPHCGKGRSEMVRSGKAKFINELAVNAGQRCVIATTPVLTECGVLRVSECFPDAPYGFTEFGLRIHNGSCLENASHFFRAKPEKIYKATLSNGISISGTADHPIKTAEGFVTLGQLGEGLEVDLYFGQRQFGPNVLANPTKLGRSFNAGEVNIAVRTARQEDVAAFLCGVFSSKKKAFANHTAISDLSALLANLGIYHRIEGCCICLSDADWENLHSGIYYTGTIRERIAAIEIKSEQETFDFTLPSTHQFVTGGIISHNSGKSHTVGGYLFPYLTHRMLKLQKPAAFYGLSRTTVLHTTFVALTYAQAKDTLWTPYYGTITSSGFFSEYHKLLRWYENKYGESLLKLNDTFVVYKHRGMAVYPAGPDIRVLRGRSRIGSSCFTADTLISTNYGLIRIDDKDLIGMRTVRGSKTREITNWAKMKWATDVVKVKLKNGMELNVTSDHKVLTLGKDLKTKRVRAEGLKGRYVGVTLGGEFPSELKRDLASEPLHVGKEAKDATVPKSILESPRDSVSSFIASCFDSAATSRNLRCTTESQKFALQLQLLLAKCGYFSRIKVKHTHSSSIYTVQLSYDSSRRFLQSEYHDQNCDIVATRAPEFTIPYTDNKYAVRAGYGKPTLASFDQNIVWVEVVGIEEMPDQWVYDITVDAKDHMLTANGVIAKNCDEIGWFDSNKDSKKVKISAHGVYDALTNSLYTVRAAAERLINNGYDDVFPGYSINVSSPSARNDMINTLGKRAQDSDSMYYVHRPTWEINPDFPRNSRLIIDAYRKDPASAEMNFGANPPLVANPFIGNHESIIGAEDRDRKNCVKLKTIMKTSRKQGQSYMYAEVEKVKKSGKPSILSLDGGICDNSYSMAGGRPDGINLIVDFVGEVIPLPGYRINHSLIYSDVVLPIMKARNCKILLADRWNSAKILDDAKMDMGDPEDEFNTFISANYSLKYRDMVSVRTCFEQGIVRLPKSEIKVSTLLEVLDSDYRDFYDGKPVAHLFKQLYTIKDLEKQVGKGDGYTDDTWRAVALLIWALLEEEYQGILAAQPVDVIKAKPSAIASTRLYSGGGGQVGSGGRSTQTLINGSPIATLAKGKGR